MKKLVISLMGLWLAASPLAAQSVTLSLTDKGVVIDASGMGTFTLPAAGI